MIPLAQNPRVRILTEHWGQPGSHTLDYYLAHEGYRAAPKAFGMKSEEVVEEVKKSGLRGRGGAGFPAGVKWGFLPKNDKPRYLAVNADESEPGTFKDRYIMEYTPHQLIEGTIITSYALKVHKAFIYIRGEYVHPWRRLRQALDEAYARGYLGRNVWGSGYDLDIVLHRGAGAYICGEETALLESLEGKKGFPRLKPPFPATEGLFQCPTIINNVETLANVPWIATHGSEAYAALGVPGSTGTRLFCLSGHLNKPGVYEIEMGVPLLEVIEQLGGGVPGGRKLKAVIPGGSSTPVLTAEEAARAHLDYDSMTKLDTFLGSGGVIVMDETTCMVKALKNLLHFYSHESCGHRLAVQDPHQAGGRPGPREGPGPAVRRGRQHGGQDHLSAGRGRHHAHPQLPVQVRPGVPRAHRGQGLPLRRQPAGRQGPRRRVRARGRRPRRRTPAPPRHQRPPPRSRAGAAADDIQCVDRPPCRKSPSTAGRSRSRTA